MCAGVLLYTVKVQASREMNRLNHVETIKIKEDAEKKHFFDSRLSTLLSWYY